MKRYTMCNDQPAQIDCRITTCKFYNGAGQCSNISPAITLNGDDCNEPRTFVCWSRKDKKIDKEKTLQNIVSASKEQGEYILKLKEQIDELKESVTKMWEVLRKKPE